MSEHTPGPWEARKSGKFREGEPGHERNFHVPNHVVSIIVDEQGRKVTMVVATCESTTLENGANARLIAAAPELLEALKWITPIGRPEENDACHRGITSMDQCQYCRRVIAAHAAITKAEAQL